MNSDLPSLIEELKRRRVFRAVIAYGVVAFTLLQITEPIMHGLHWPDEVLTILVVALAIGFPIVVGLAWIFDVNAGHIERTQPAPNLRGPRLALSLAVISLLAAAPGLGWYFLRAKPSALPAAATTSPAKPEPSPLASEANAAPSIAVLPFADMSAAKDQEYFADGLAEELLDLLAKVPGLKVTGRVSSFAFKGKDDDLRAIAQRLGVANILEGSVRKSGEQLRITTQLVSASDGYNLWSETYDRKLTDVFAVQDEIAGAVVGALKLKLMPAAANQPRGTPNIEAHNQVLLARQFRSHGKLDDVLLAQKAYLKATQLDPNYAAAWAGLSRSTFTLADIVATTQVEADAEFAQAREEAEKAILLGPDVAAGYLARGLSRANRDWNWTGAGEDFQRATALEPENTDALVAYAVYFLWAVGRSTDELAALRKATEIDPLSAIAWNTLGWALISSGDQPAAQKAIARALEIAPSSSVGAYHLGLSLLLQGRTDEALSSVRRSESVYLLEGEALVQHTLGHAQEATRALETLIAQRGHSSAIQIGEVYAWRGENDKAFEWLQRARAQRDPGIGLLKPSAFLRSLHSDPRWKPLLVSVNLPVD